MNLQPLDIILRRLSTELRQRHSVALGEGIPQLVRPLLPEGVAVVPLSGNGSIAPVEVTVVDSSEVSANGDLPDPRVASPQAVAAPIWIVATRHTHEDGEPKLVKACRDPLVLPKKVSLVITELGVIQVADVGLVLREIAPGVATDDVKLKTQASLHVADDIRLMEL